MSNKPAEEINQAGQLNSKIWKVLDKATEIIFKISALLMLVIIITIWYQVFARLGGVSTKGIVELDGYILIWLCFFGTTYALKKGRHIRVDIIYRLLSEKVRFIFLIIGNSICVFFSLILAWEGIKLIKMYYEIEQVSLILHIPLYIIYIGMPVGMILFAIEAIREVVLTINERKVATPISLEAEVEQEIEALENLDEPNK